MASARRFRRHRATAPGGVVKFAEAPGANPNYIFPSRLLPHQSLSNIDQFFNLMWPLLYLSNPDQPTLDYSNSMAYPPVWSANGTVVTVTMKHYVWSDGIPVTARDVIFYVNELGEAEGPHGATTAARRSSSTSRLHSDQRHDGQVRPQRQDQPDVLRRQRARRHTPIPHTPGTRPLSTEPSAITT